MLAKSASAKIKLWLFGSLLVLIFRVYETGDYNDQWGKKSDLIVHFLVRSRCKIKVENTNNPHTKKSLNQCPEGLQRPLNGERENDNTITVVVLQLIDN